MFLNCDAKYAHETGQRKCMRTCLLVVDAHSRFHRRREAGLLDLCVSLGAEVALVREATCTYDREAVVREQQ
jgi:hypothetical protein